MALSFEGGGGGNVNEGAFWVVDLDALLNVLYTGCICRIDVCLVRLDGDV